MPEFIMPLGDDKPVEYALQWQRATIGYFAKGYFEAMFFTECHSDNPELQDATINDLSPEAWERSLADCKAFEEANAELLESVYGVQGKYEREEYCSQRAGNDYWYTRNGHGTGFWDRGLGEAGDKLANAARYHSVDLYRGDDGLLYLA